MTRPGTRQRIDWGQAYAYFHGLGPTRTFAAVAERFGVSDTAVRVHAKPGADFPEGWEQRSAEADRRRNGQLERKAEQGLERRNERTLAFIEAYREKALEALVDEDGKLKQDVAIDPDDAASRMPGLVKLEQLLMGEATERNEVSFAELQGALRIAVVVAKEFIAGRDYELFLARFEAELGEQTGGPE